MIPQHHIDQLREANACESGMNWLLAEDRTWESWWRDCPYSGWLLWFAEFVCVDEDLQMLAFSDCDLLIVPERPHIRLRCANAVRARIPWEIIEAAIAKKMG